MIERVGDVVVYDGSDAEEDEEREGGVLWVFSRYIYIYIGGSLVLLVACWCLVYLYLGCSHDV